MAVTETGHLASREVDGLYRRHGTEVYRYAFAVLGNHADAEDVTQTTFLNAYRALEQGVRPRKPSNWLLAIASNAIKQRFRSERSRPRHVELDEQTAGADQGDAEGPTIGELLAALTKIPPQQRQAIVLREFEGRSYAEIAEILGVTTSALETLLFRARRSLAEELEHQLTCTEAQLAISRAADGRLGRKEKRRLRDHLGECGDCARFASVQKRHRRALKGLALLPVPLSLHFLKDLQGTATAATMPTVGAAGAAAAGGASVATLPATGGAIAAAAGAGTGGAVAGGGVLAGGVAVKAAAVLAAAAITGGVAVSASTKLSGGHGHGPPANVTQTKPGARVGQVAPRGVLVPGNGVARGKASAPGQTKRGASTASHRATGNGHVHSPAAGTARGAHGANTKAQVQKGKAKAAKAKATTSHAGTATGHAGSAGHGTKTTKSSSHSSGSTTDSTPSGNANKTATAPAGESGATSGASSDTGTTGHGSGNGHNGP